LTELFPADHPHHGGISGALHLATCPLKLPGMAMI
jgi:hypothetical protein